MLYNVLLVSAIQQSESAIHIYTSPLFCISFPFTSWRLLKDHSFEVSIKSVNNTEWKRQNCMAHHKYLISNRARLPSRDIGDELNYYDFCNWMQNSTQ